MGSHNDPLSIVADADGRQLVIPDVESDPELPAYVRVVKEDSLHLFQVQDVCGASPLDHQGVIQHLLTAPHPVGGVQLQELVAHTLNLLLPRLAFPPHVGLYPLLQVLEAH